MARINLSISNAMKEEMDVFQDENWSAVAQEAFARRIHIHKIRGIDVNEANLERLRQSRSLHLETVEAEAQARGRQWALQEAEFDELARVAALSGSHEPDFRVLGLAVSGDGDQNWREGNQCGLALFDIGSVNSGEVERAMVAGFIQGAADVLDEL